VAGADAVAVDPFGVISGCLWKVPDQSFGAWELGGFGVPRGKSWCNLGRFCPLGDCPF
jgi:hypothetical protein